MNTATATFASKYCVGCGKQLHVTAQACPGCGAPQGRMAGTGEKKSRIGAALLALFLGGLGIHRFYLGRPTSGIFYLLFCWTFIPAIIAFIEFLGFLLMGDENFQKQYG